MSQTTDKDSVVIAAFMEHADSLFLAATRETLVLYNGREYVSSDVRVNGQPCYLTDQFEEGSVEYFDQFFKGIPLKYDIFTDDVIVEHFDGANEITLNKGRVNSFSYLGNHFVKIVDDTSVINLPKPGFYQLLYDGQLKVYAKRRKTIYETIENRKIKKEYISQNLLYIKKDDTFYLIKSKRSAMAPFKEHKKELNSALRINKLKFRKEKEKSLKVIAQEYDKLSRK